MTQVQPPQPQTHHWSGRTRAHRTAHRLRTGPVNRPAAIVESRAFPEAVSGHSMISQNPETKMCERSQLQIPQPQTHDHARRALAHRAAHLQRTSGVLVQRRVGFARRPDLRRGTSSLPIPISRNELAQDDVTFLKISTNRFLRPASPGAPGHLPEAHRPNPDARDRTLRARPPDPWHNDPGVADPRAPYRSPRFLVVPHGSADMMR